MLIKILSEPRYSFAEKLMYILIIAFCVLFSLSVHELSHGLAAYMMGDRTAKNTGRLSLNPMHHLDPIGAICLFLFGFGWAKPVPVNPWNFRRKKAGMVLTSLAGPFSNFLVAFLAQIGTVVLGKMTFHTESIGFNIASVSYMICVYLGMINLGLGLFNLIPIPPLDGSKVLNALLPERMYFKIMQYEQFGFIVLIILINMPYFNVWLGVARDAIINFYNVIILAMGL